MCYFRSYMKVFPLTFLALLFMSLIGHAQEVGDRLPDDKGVTFSYDQSGHTCNVRIGDDHRILVFFLDTEGKIEYCPFKKVIIRLENLPRNDETQIVFHSGTDAPYLTCKRFIRPPNNFRLKVFLYPSDEGSAGRISVPTQRLLQL